MSNPICNYDFTASAKITSKEEIEELLREHCKKWAFQKEKGSKNDFLHFQGRFSLKLKARMSAVIKIFTNFHISPTSKENSDNFFYVMKEETRIEGPWTSNDTIRYIPRQIKNITMLHKWQQHIIDDADIFNTRHINLIIDTEGNIGKSTIKTYISVHGIGRALPYVNDYKDILRIVMDTKKMPLYIIDIPRALKKEGMNQFFAGIETLKDGYAYDDRYRFKEEYFDSPNIWVFSNIVPKTSMLSKDRWIFWKVINNDLVKSNVSELTDASSEFPQ